MSGAHERPDVHFATVVLFKHVNYPGDYTSDSLRALAAMECAPYPDEVERCLKEISAPYSAPTLENMPYLVVVYSHAQQPVYWARATAIRDDRELSLYWWFVDTLGGATLLFKFVPALEAVREALATTEVSEGVGK